MASLFELKFIFEIIKIIFLGKNYCFIPMGPGGNFKFLFLQYFPKTTDHAITILISKFKAGGSLMLLFLKIQSDSMKQCK